MAHNFALPTEDLPKYNVFRRYPGPELPRNVTKAYFTNLMGNLGQVFLMDCPRKTRMYVTLSTAVVCPWGYESLDDGNQTQIWKKGSQSSNEMELMKGAHGQHCSLEIQVQQRNKEHDKDVNLSDKGS